MPVAKKKRQRKTVPFFAEEGTASCKTSHIIATDDDTASRNFSTAVVFSMCICIYGEHSQHRMGQPGRLPILPGQLNRGKRLFPCPCSCLRIWSRETGSAVPTRVSLLILHTRTQSGPNSRDSFRFLRRPSHITSTAIGLVLSLPGDTIAYRRCLLPRVHWHRSSSPFPTPTILLILLLVLIVCSCCCW